jgi:surface polysaccharide O-acyltransferase-like enzyme
MVWIDIARVLSSFAVVVLHVSAAVVVMNSIGTNAWWGGNFFDSMVRWCVPVFVMISGALLLDPQKEESFRSFYSKRISKILVPLIFWTIFFLFWSSLKKFIKNEPFELSILLESVYAGKPYYHMWFMFMIVGIYAFTPFFRKIVQASSHAELIALVVMCFLLSMAGSFIKFYTQGSDGFFLNWFLSYIPYFFLGHLVRHSQFRFGIPKLIAIFLLSFFGTAFAYYFVSSTCGIAYGSYFYDYMSPMVVVMSAVVIYICREAGSRCSRFGFLQAISPLTLGVYLVHPIFIDMAVLITGYTKSNLSFLAIPVVASVVFCASVFTAWIIRAVPLLRRVI